MKKTHQLDVEEDRGIRSHISHHSSTSEHHHENRNHHRENSRSVNPFDLGLNDGNSSMHNEESSNMSNSEGQNFLRKKRANPEREMVSNFFSGLDIDIKLFCDEKMEEDVKKYFSKTHLKLQDSYTLEFISRFICYKQNFPYESLKKIHFYTFNTDKTRQYWANTVLISDVINHLKLQAIACEKALDLYFDMVK